jgi:glycosyltransferase involved in cell wall biosynthesis
MPARIRVLHCPDLVGGQSYQLAKAERELGLESYCVAVQPHPFGYPADRFLTSGGEIASQIARWRLLSLALGEYDVIHFNFGQSIMPQRLPMDIPSQRGYPAWSRRLFNLYAGPLELRDLKFLKRRHKCIVMTYQGDDARQGDFLRSHYQVSPVEEAGYYSEDSDRLKRERIEVVGRYADAIFAVNPDLLHVLPVNAQFMPYAHLDVAKIQPRYSSLRAVPKVLHAPSHQGVKGTRFIVDAVNRLKSEGVQFEFVMVEGMAHSEAMQLYADADLLVDQLLVGWYGGLSVELMALGKPVVAYIREEDMRFVPPPMRTDFPVISATPATIYDVLRELLTTRRHELRALGMRSRQYVETWHNPTGVASMLKTTYEGILENMHRREPMHHEGSY